MIFRESTHAHRWLDGLDGIEIGGAAHNPFGIAGCRNVDYSDAPEAVRMRQEASLCGRVLPVDVVDDGQRLATFADGSLGYVLSSHVLEHFPDPLGAIESWCRVLRVGGLIYAIVPQPWALEADRGRPLTTYEHLVDDWLACETVETHADPPGQGPRGHYHVFTADSLAEIVARWDAEAHVYPTLALVDQLDPDDKVGNGFALVWRKTA